MEMKKDNAFVELNKDAFFSDLNRYIDYMQQEESCGEVIAVTRVDGCLVSQRIDAIKLLDVSEVVKCELIIFDGANLYGDSWKMIFHPGQLVSTFINENPIK